MGLSSRHHYLPEFYVKNFADSDGLIYIYNKETKRMEGKRSPKSVFFEWDRNTFSFNGVETDNVEKLFGDFDNHIAPDIMNVLRNKHFAPEEVMSIVVLAANLKWRTPASDDMFSTIREDVSAEDLSIKIKIKNPTLVSDDKVTSEIENSEIFKEAKRLLLSVRPLLEHGKQMEIYQNSFLNIYDRFPSIIGDVPVIEKPNSDFRKLENFIFPLSPSTTFVYNNSTPKQILNPLFYLSKDLSIFHLSGKYVACKSKNHLEEIVNAYAKIEKDKLTDRIMRYVFDTITI